MRLPQHEPALHWRIIALVASVMNPRRCGGKCGINVRSVKDLRDSLVRSTDSEVIWVDSFLLNEIRSGA